MLQEAGLGIQIARFVEEAQVTYRSERPPDVLLFGRLRVFCSRDVDQIVEYGGTLSITHAMVFGRGEPFLLERAGFDDSMKGLQEYTRQARANGITCLSYVSQNPSTSRRAEFAIPKLNTDGLALVTFSRTQDGGWFGRGRA